MSGPKRSFPPNGFYENTQEWIISDSSSGKKLIQEIYPTQYYMRLNGLPDSNLYAGGAPAPYVALVPGARVYGSNGAVITPDNKLLWEASIEWNKTPQMHSIFSKKFLPSITFSENTLALLTYINCQFYHWMFDIIPRIDLVQRSGIPIDGFITNQLKYSYQYESLDLLKIPRERLIQVNDQFHMEIKNLVIPSLPRNTTRWACQFLRKNFLNDKWNALNRNRRIYICRDQAINERKVVNEEEIFNVLDAYNFERVFLEQLPLEEQIKTFASAEFVVSPHGAGLSHLTFCKPGTKVIELFAPTYRVSIYYLICYFNDLRYNYLIGSGESHIQCNVQCTEHWHGKDNMIINKQELVKLLKSLLS